MCEGNKKRGQERGVRDKYEGPGSERTCKMGSGKGVRGGLGEGRGGVGEGHTHAMYDVLHTSSDSCTHMSPSTFPSTFPSIFLSIFPSMFSSRVEWWESKMV